MSKPETQAFFLGRALAEVLGEKIESSVTNLISEVNKLSAEQQAHFKQFTEEVQTRAEQKAQAEATVSSPTTTVGTTSGTDLQENIDELRAEIARLKAELNQYRTQQNS